MKVEVNETAKTHERPFPKLMKVTANVKNQGMIVLMLSSGYGTVICGGVNWDQGQWSGDWLMDHFQDFNGSITLSNE